MSFDSQPVYQEVIELINPLVEVTGKDLISVWSLIRADLQSLQTPKMMQKLASTGVVALELRVSSDTTAPFAERYLIGGATTRLVAIALLRYSEQANDEGFNPILELIQLVETANPLLQESN